MKALVLVLLFSSVFCVTTKAQTATGEQVQSRCKGLVGAANSAETFAGGFCAGFVEGVIDSQYMREAADSGLGPSNIPRYCIPQEATYDQIVKVFVKYLDEHPELLHKPACSLLIASWVKAFPCGK
jgi:Rap1a immunity proteins